MLMYNARAIINRRTTNSLGSGPSTPVATNVRCQYVPKEMQEMQVEWGFAWSAKVKFPPGTDINQGDVINFTYLAFFHDLDEQSSYSVVRVSREGGNLSQMVAYLETAIQ